MALSTKLPKFFSMTICCILKDGTIKYYIIFGYFWVCFFIVAGYFGWFFLRIQIVFLTLFYCGLILEKD